MRVRRWERTGCAKIALKVGRNEDGEAKLHDIAQAAQDAGLVHYIVCDAGRTQIAAGSLTVIGIGPAPISKIDAITGRGGLHPLKLM